MNICIVGVVVRVSRLGRICCYQCRVHYLELQICSLTSHSHRRYSHRSYYVVVEWIIMSFSVDSFVKLPSLLSLNPSKKVELLSLAQHYKLEATQAMKKGEIRTFFIEYLVEEEIVSEDEIPSTTDAIELKRLELQDKEKEREAQLKMKEMELQEQELALQLKLKEIEIAAASTAPPVPTSRQTEFDVTKQVRFVPPFQETEVDKYFLHFEEVASSMS